MAKPNLDHILMTIAMIEGIPTTDYPAFRKVLHHAFYYHNQGWMVLTDWQLDQLVYGLQYMTGREYAECIEAYTAREWRRMNKYLY